MGTINNLSEKLQQDIIVRDTMIKNPAPLSDKDTAKKQAVESDKSNPPQSIPDNFPITNTNFIGWFLALFVPICLYFYLRKIGLNYNAVMFTAIISSSLIMWIFSLLPPFIPPLFAVLFFLLFGLAPSEIILSGFSSSSFFLSISVLGLGVVITNSGLTYRYTLWLIKLLPQHTFWYQVALFFTGILFTPIVPTILGRASILAPVLDNVVNGLNETTKKKSGTLLYSTALDSISYLSAIFLTSAPANFIIFSLLPMQEQQTFQFMYWVYAAAITGGIMIVMYFVLSALLFRGYRPVKLSKETVEKEIELLGKMSWREWISFFCILVLAIGIGTDSVHKIKIPFIAFSVFFVLLYLGILSAEDFTKKLDWAFLFLLGSIVSITVTMEYLEIDKLLMVKLSWLGIYMRQDFKFFVLILTIMILGVRLFLPMATTMLIFSTALIPIANANGVSCWLIGFIILTISEVSLFNYQSPHIMFFRSKINAELQCNERSMIIFRVILLIVRIAAIYCSIPYWIHLGIL